MSKSVCPKCFGQERVIVPGSFFSPMGVSIPCECVKERDIRDRLNTVWPNLGHARAVEASPLTSQVENDLIVTAPPEVLKNHMARVCREMSSKWRARVITDADLMTTWLYSANEVGDGDVLEARERGENTVSRINDLVEPFQLLVIRLGVKAARNSAMPEVLLEALNHRTHLGRPTWVADTPDWRLGLGHLAFSDAVGEALQGWTRVELTAEYKMKPFERSTVPASPSQTVDQLTPYNPPKTSRITDVPDEVLEQAYGVKFGSTKKKK